jgi:hypothetical protein
MKTFEASRPSVAVDAARLLNGAEPGGYPLARA